MANLPVNIHTLPASNGADITDIEYRVNGGSAISSGGITGFTIEGLTGGVEVDVEIRAVNLVGAAVWSIAKTATPPADPEPDVTAPTLSSPTDAANGSTGANISVSTDEDNGTLYWFISTSATPPSAENLKAGTGAVVAGNQAVTGTGTQNASPTGLTASTAYYTYFLHRDAAGNDSTIASADGFTTAAPAITWLAYDDFNRADTAVASGGLGVTSGKDGTGGGLTWVGVGGIKSNKADLSSAQSGGAGLSYLELGVGPKSVEAIVDIGAAGSRQPILYALFNPAAANSGVYWGVDLTTGNSFVRVYRQGSGTITLYDAAGPLSGTYHVKLAVYPDATVKLFVDETEVFSGTHSYVASLIADGTATKAAMGIELRNYALFLDNFGVRAT